MPTSTAHAANTGMTLAARERLYIVLARRFHAGVYNYLRWLCHDAALAEDLTQETFVQIWRNPPELRGDRALRAWVYRVARNEYLQHRRRARLETVALNDPAEVLTADWAGPDPQIQLEREQLRGAVRGAVGRLPDLCREVVVLHNLEGLSLEEVSEVLRIPKGTVKSRRARAFALLRRELAREVNRDEMR